MLIRSVISGTYDMGDNPRVEFYVGDNGRYLFMEMHDGINDDMKNVIGLVGWVGFMMGLWLIVGMLWMLMLKEKNDMWVLAYLLFI